MKKQLRTQTESDGKFGVRCVFRGKTCKIQIERVSVKGYPILKLSKLGKPLCRHRFVLRCPKYINCRSSTPTVHSVVRPKRPAKKIFAGITAAFVILGSAFFIKCSKVPQKESSYQEEEGFISETFISTCMGNGFSSLNEWQVVCREKYKLDYIAWSAASDFMLVKESDKGILYYGKWIGKNGSGEVYAYKEE